jgi:hypothetical protein
MEMQVNKYLGSAKGAGDNSARYATMLKFIEDKSGVTQAEITNYVKGGISTAVDTARNSAWFVLDVGTNTRHAQLTLNTDGLCVLRYDGNTSDESYDQQLTASTLNALLAKMPTAGFSKDDVNTAQYEADLISNKSKFDVTTTDTLNLAKTFLTDFFTTGNQANQTRDYKALLAIGLRYNKKLLASMGTRQYNAVSLAGDTVDRAIVALSPALSQVFFSDRSKLMPAAGADTTNLPATDNIDELAAEVTLPPR